MSHRYALSYSPFANTKDEEKLIAFVNNAKSVKTWTHPFIGLFVLQSDLDVEELLDVFEPFFGSEGRFALILAGRFAGILPVPSAAWFKETGAILSVDKQLND